MRSITIRSFADRTRTEKKNRIPEPARSRTDKILEISDQDREKFEYLGPIRTGRSPDQTVDGSLGGTIK